MNEEKGVVPGYTRIGVCKECGVGVYTPEGAATAGTLSLVSDCACEGGPLTGTAGTRVEKPSSGERTSGVGKKAA